MSVDIIVWTLNGVTIVASCYAVYFARRARQHSERAQRSLERVQQLRRGA